MSQQGCSVDEEANVPRQMSLHPASSKQSADTLVALEIKIHDAIMKNIFMPLPLI